jgi:hypothetical protein
VRYRQILNLNALRAGFGDAPPPHPILVADMKALPGIVGVFQHHGRTLRGLQERYPREERIWQAVARWEDCCRDLESAGFTPATA